MPESRVLIVAKVYQAANLPKADRLSETDAYVRLRCQGQEARTKARKNDAFPRWDRTLVVPASVDLEAPSGVCRLEVWDEDLIGDDPIGSVEVELAELVGAQRLDRTFELALAPGHEPREGVAPRLEVALAYQLGYEEVKASFAGLEGVRADDRERELLVPAPDLGPDVWLSIEFEKRSLDVKVVVAGAASPDRYGLELEDDHDLKVRHRRFAPPLRKRFGSGEPLLISQAVEIDDAALDARFSKLYVTRHSLAEVDRVSVAEVIARGAGAPLAEATFAAAAAALGARDGVIVDAGDRRVAVPHEGCHVVVEFDDRELEVSLLVHEGSPADVEHDLEVEGQTPRKGFKRFKRPRRLDRFAFTHEVELEDLERSRTRLEQVAVVRRRLTEPRRWALSELLPLRG